MRLTLASLMAVCLVITVTAMAKQPKTRADAPLEVGELTLEPGSYKYPAEIAARGAQGSVSLNAKIGPDGRLADAQVVTSSRSPELDALAVEYVNDLKLNTVSEANGAQVAVVKVTFSRDTAMTVLKKTCAEFNVDLAFARSLDPAATAKDLRSYKLATTVVMFAEQRSKEELDVFAKNFKTAPAAIEAACATQPDANFAKALFGVISAR